MPLVNANADSICLSEKFSSMLANKEFYGYVNDALAYAEKRFLSDYKPAKFYHGFKLYGSYTRKDVCRILNWAKDESAVVYGYRVKYNTCPIFVTYKRMKTSAKALNMMTDLPVLRFLTGRRAAELILIRQRLWRLSSRKH